MGLLQQYREPTTRGFDMGQIEGDHLSRLSDSHKADLQNLLEQLKGNPYEDVEEFILQANLAFHDLPRSIRRQLIEFQRRGNGAGAMLIRGLPVDTNLPDTPSDPRQNAPKTTWASEFWSAVFSTPIGEPFGYIQEKGGQLFQNILPTPKGKDQQTSESSTVLLEFHTETCFHPFLPDFVLLYCLRQDHDKVASTLVTSARQLLPLLSPSQVAVLRQPVFETGVDMSFGGNQKGGALVTPVLYGNEADPYLRYDLDLMVGRTREANNLLQELRLLVNENANYVRLEPGDLVIIDNRRAVHARSTFTARFDGQDRWLQRLMVIRSLIPSAAERHLGERIIRTTQFTP